MQFSIHIILHVLVGDGGEVEGGGSEHTTAQVTELVGKHILEKTHYCQISRPNYSNVVEVITLLTSDNDDAPANIVNSHHSIPRY